MAVAAMAASVLSVGAYVFAQVVDTSAPVVSITAPAASSSVSGSVAVTATASDDVGVVGVQFKLDGTNLGAEATTTPYTVTWNTLLSSNGVHNLTATARDAVGSSTQSAVVAVTVSNVVTPVPTPVPTPMNVRQSLEIGPKGNVHMQNAKVLSISTNSLTVKTWGITFTVSVTADTKLRAHNGGTITLSEVLADHVLDVHGSINMDTGVVTAREIRDDSLMKDNTARQNMMKDIMLQIEVLKKQLKDLRGGQKGGNSSGGNDQ